MLHKIFQTVLLPLIEVQTIKANGGFHGFFKLPFSLCSFLVFFLPHSGLFLLITYGATDSKFTEFQRIHLLFNCSPRRQVSTWILSAPCIMSKNDRVGVDPAKVTRSHSFTETNGINETSLSGPVRLPLPSSTLHSIRPSLFPLCLCNTLAKPSSTTFTAILPYFYAASAVSPSLFPS